MKKFWRVLLLMSIVLIPTTSLSFEIEKTFALANIYEILEFACYFIFVYLLIMAKVFETRSITKNQIVE